MDVVQMQRRLSEYLKSLFNDGTLDAQFSQLQLLQDESNPDFVVEVVTLFFSDSAKLLDNLSRALEQPNVDFRKVNNHVHQLKGSSSSIGAQRVKNACIAFRSLCEEQNIPASVSNPFFEFTLSCFGVEQSYEIVGWGVRCRCLRCLQLVKQEYLYAKNKLETLFKLEKQVVAAGGSIPSLDAGS